MSWRPAAVSDHTGSHGVGAGPGRLATVAGHTSGRGSQTATADTTQGVQSGRCRRVASAGAELAVYEIGSCDLPPVVVAHGVGSSWRFVAEAFGPALAAAGRRLVTYDLRGHGASSPLAEAADHRLERHVSDLHAVVTSVAAEVVAGISLGGHVAVAYAAAGAPLTGVAACLPAWTGRAVPGAGVHAAVAGDVARLGVPALIERFRGDREMAPWLRDLLVRDWSSHVPTSLAAALTALDGGLAPTERDLRNLTVPLGVVGWVDDPGHPLAVARAWAGWAPRGVFVQTSLAAVGEWRGALGAAAVAALQRAGALVRPPTSEEVADPGR